MAADDFSPRIAGYSPGVTGPEVRVRVYRDGREGSVAQTGAEIVTLINAELAQTDWQTPSVAATATALTTISAFRVVTLSAAGAALYEPIDGNQGLATAMSSTAATAGNLVNVHNSGIIPMTGAGMTPGQVYYAGPNGVPTTVKPTSGLVFQVGQAIDADTFAINFGDPLLVV